MDSQDFVRSIPVPWSGSAGNVAVDGAKVGNRAREKHLPLVHHSVVFVAGCGWIGLSMVREADDGFAGPI